MPRVPRIRRAVPSGDAIRSLQPLPVIVTMVWHDGSRDDAPASAIAWTRSEVEVEWTTPWGDVRRDWVRADQVRRDRTD